MFEYKVRTKHKLGYKEFKLYATTNIEEFFNRNNIEYVRNMTDTVEHRQLKEIEKLHSIIKEAREYMNKHEIEAVYLDCKLYETEVYKDILEILDKAKENK